MEVNFIIAPPSEKYVAREALRLGGKGGSSTPSRGQGGRTTPAGGRSGRSTPAGGTRQWSSWQYGAWTAGTAWSSSAWQGSAQVISTANDGVSDVCGMRFAQPPPVPVVWLYVAVLIICAFLIASVSFAVGWYLSKLWYSHVEGPVRKTRKGRALIRCSSVQCNRASTDLNEIMKMTIDAIRDELRLRGDSTNGNKLELAERLQLRRIRNDELAGLHADDDHP